MIHDLLLAGTPFVHELLVLKALDAPVGGLLQLVLVLAVVDVFEVGHKIVVAYVCHMCILL